MADYCGQYNTCSTCASASGCSWCPTANKCLGSTSLKSTDTVCNQMNTISAAFSCVGNNSIASDSRDHVDFSLYKGQIADKIRPPNVYMTASAEYSPETVMGNMNNVRNELQMYQKQLPDTIANAVEDNIRPMVSGILSENYYIQM